MVPWINRELNALLRENTRNVMEVVDVVMNYLKTHHICSRPFRNLLTAYLGRNADHFIHEAYTFMRSPYDMVGYDRHVNYYERPTTPVPFIDVSESEGNSSDVMIIEETPEIIEVHSSASDDDVIVTSSFVPKPQADEASTSKRSRQASIVLCILHSVKFPCGSIDDITLEQQCFDFNDKKFRMINFFSFIHFR